jgi:hypothetical protein
MKTHTADTIRAKCIEEGECLLWPGAICGNKPTAWHAGKPTNLRHLFWNLTHPTKQLGDGQILRISCRDERCLAHMVRSTRADLMRQISKKLVGIASVRAARAAARRRRSTVTHEIAELIRQDSRPPQQLADQFGLNRRTVQRIRSFETWAPVPGSSVFNWQGSAT